MKVNMSCAIPSALATNLPNTTSPVVQIRLSDTQGKSAGLSRNMPRAQGGSLTGLWYFIQIKCLERELKKLAVVFWQSFSV